VKKETYGGLFVYCFIKLQSKGSAPKVGRKKGHFERHVGSCMWDNYFDQIWRSYGGENQWRSKGEGYWGHLKRRKRHDCSKKKRRKRPRGKENLS